ncbi:hypothetical protein HPB49_011499 [Dermacentor silvarum]|uniref:Uncharacterized protein n=1 Tax=Dermacentor silvarum TaxID=543639 RepID=A0ACB8CEW6_DERSI|nr:hypothetical protein HPB49_011499 [Dermacentor silvarum]
MRPVEVGLSDVHGGFWSFRASSRTPKSYPAHMPWYGGAADLLYTEASGLASPALLPLLVLRAQVTPGRRMTRMTLQSPCFRIISSVQSTSSWLDNGSVAVLSMQQKHLLRCGPPQISRRL